VLYIIIIYQVMFGEGERADDSRFEQTVSDGVVFEV
jgi:hypothetical protein